MTKKVGTLFDAKSKNLFDLASSSETGYKIPEYQRPYDWSETNVKRLFTDCLRGFYRLGNGVGTSAYCFLGSLILVEEKSNEPSFGGRSVAVIDGQQRLTTLSLMACALHARLHEIDVRQISGVNESVCKFIESEKDSLLIQLSEIGLGTLRQRRVSIAFFPKIVRASDGDNRASEASNAEYNSPIAIFLNSFAEACKLDHHFTPPILPETRAGEQIKNNYLKIREYISNINDKDSYDDYDATIVPKSNFTRAQYKSLFLTLRDHFDDDETLIEKTLSDIKKNDKLTKISRFLLFCNYFLSNVILTTITAEDESLAFDMFDSLNTTGQPLTALETLKPIVIGFENDTPEKYKGSESKKYFKEISNLLDGPDLTTTKKQVLTRDAITNAVLLMSGDKLGHETSGQRAKLRSQFDIAASSSKGQAREYIKNIRNVVQFRNAYWRSDYENLGMFHPAKHLEEIKFLMSIIGGLKTHLALPILQRYWCPTIKQQDQTEFLEATRSVVAYLILRRSFTGNTAGIDSELRKILSKDLSADGATAAYLKTGVEVSYRKPTISELRQGLRYSLETGRNKFTDKNAWVEKVARNPLYSHSHILSKTLHLFASDGCHPDKKKPGHWLRAGVRSSSKLERANYKSWLEEATQTVEHVAPQSPKNKSEWDGELYKVSGLIDSLGNLTLLPANLNREIGNTSWSRKSKFFSAISCENDEDQQDLFKKAKADGIEFSKKFTKLIDAGEHLPLVVPISLSQTWKATEVFARSQNIASLAYDKIYPWLK